MSRRFYITTPIYYPNGEPHLGHVYTTLCADVVAQYHRRCGDDTWFLTGTDEHGIKMVKTATERGIEPQTLADKNAAVFETLWQDLKVTNDDFIRTSSSRHKAGATAIVEQMLASGDIYLGAYEGWYDEGQEEFVTENNAKESDFKSVISGRPLVRYKEPTYFFKLSKYVAKVQAAIEKNEIKILPDIRRNEVLSKLKMGVEDLSISRSSLKWGIPLPNDPEHVLYVWIDALSNYITALGYGENRREGEGVRREAETASSSHASLFDRFWPADVHLIGKEIMWFHTVYWPAMLIALGLPLPKVVFAHGWWTSDGRKMSKTLGNFVDLDRLRHVIGRYSLDALRFYLLRAAPFGNDLDWKDAEFATSYTELGNVVGNLLNRTLNMIGKYRGGVVPTAGDPGEAGVALLKPLHSISTDLAAAYEGLELQRAALVPIELARAANQYIDQTKPFTLAKDPAMAAQLDTVLNLCANAIYKTLVALLPICPEKAVVGLRQMNIEVEGKTLSELLSTTLPAGHRLGTAEVLFPRIEIKPEISTQGAV